MGLGAKAKICPLDMHALFGLHSLSDKFELSMYKNLESHIKVKILPFLEKQEARTAAGTPPIDYLHVP